MAVPLQAGEGVVPGIGSFRRGTGREPGILTRQSRGGGRVGVSRGLPVGVLRGVPRDRVPRPPRGGRRPGGPWVEGGGQGRPALFLRGPRLCLFPSLCLRNLWAYGCVCVCVCFGVYCS